MKLVRDKIPELIRSNGELACIRIADEHEYLTLLCEKLQEEVGEYLASGEAEELADIMEVLYALAAALGLSEHDLEQLRLAKARARGRFEKRIIWHGSRRLEPLPLRESRTPSPGTTFTAYRAVPLFDVNHVVSPGASADDLARRRRRSSTAITERHDEAEGNRGQLQLTLDVPSGGQAQSAR
jgi:predicted house-cleaning noncanonical NTP pyrophosphatase (MazG superfamily)